jgi:O-antigen/teichoic acid export membrane protein
MKSDTKEVGKNTLIYGLGNALNKLLGFILIPIYTSFISISDFGVLSILEVSIIALIQILNFGFVAGHQRYFFIKKENNTYGGFLFSVNVGMLFLVLVFTLPSFFFINDISRLLFGSIDFTTSVVLTIVIIIFEILTIIPFQILQFESRPVLYVILGFIKLLVSLLFTVLFVVEYDMGIYGIMLGRTIGIIFLYVLQIILVISKRLVVEFDFTHLKEVFKYGKFDS